jgi:agmatinase
MQTSKPVCTFLGCEGEFAESSIVLFGAPFDGTASYRPGARFAGAAMRAESYSIETFSLRRSRDLTDCRIFDGGELELPFGNTPRVLEIIREHCQGLLEQGKFPAMIGGEHLVTLGAVRAAAERYPDLHILHLDAHADLRDEYLGESLSHACVMRRCWEIVGDGRIWQFGIRSADREEYRWGKGRVKTRLFDFQGLEEAVERLAGKPVYLTVDLDVLDPGEFPGTGTPEAGGVSYRELLRALERIMQLRVVAWDLTELSPPCDPSGISTSLACKLLRELLLLTDENLRAGQPADS